MEYERSVPQLKGLVNKTYPQHHESNISLHLLTELDGLWFESRYAQETPFSKTSKPVVGPSQPPLSWVPGHFPGCKAARV
jgi:hypothetical protein